MAEKKDFANAVYAACRKRGIKQCELARMIGVTDASVSLWLGHGARRRVPKLIPFMRICDILGLDPGSMTFPELEIERRAAERKE